MVKYFIATLFLIMALVLFLPRSSEQNIKPVEKAKSRFWDFQSVDTMKYSRDLAREKLNDDGFDAIIEAQVKNISEIGATHIAIATPYDEEFIPILKRWTAAARKYNLKIWFRGNWSGWEGWFEYKKISREEHIQKTIDFIRANNELFQDGDVFTACPECENGGPGDPRYNGDLASHRGFLIEEYAAVKKIFQEIGKSVAANYNAMNGDVARLVMNKEIVKALGGVVAIDHYVAEPKQLADDIRDIQSKSGGKIVLTEFGVPIPDIHGELTQEKQAEWIREALGELIKIPELTGVNYWVNIGGSTALWTDRDERKLAVDAIADYYKPPIFSGFVKNELNNPISDAQIESDYNKTLSQNDGFFQLPYVKEGDLNAKISSIGYIDRIITTALENRPSVIILKKEQENIVFKILKLFKKWF